MPEETNNTPEVPAVPAAPVAPFNDAAARQKRIEDFLLDPDKAIFRTLEEFRTAIEPILTALAGVDLNGLEQIVGKDGVTPRRGVEYFNEQDIKAFEAFIISKIPKVGVELASRAQVEQFIRDEVAKIPRIKGDPGAPGKPGKNGNDGSPDTGVDIVKKLRGLGKNQMLRIDDIRGLENVLKRYVTDEQFDELKRRVDDMKIVIPANTSGGSSEGGEATDPTAIHTDGTNEFDGLTEDATPASGDYFIAERASDGVKIKVPFSAFAGVGGGGDMLAATYDPNGVGADVFDMANMVEAADAKIMTATERTNIAASKTKTDLISVTQAVDLDTIESDLAGVKTKTDHISVSQAVDLDTIEARVNALDAAVVLKGSWDASAGTFPGGGSAQAGDSYIVSVGGTVGGQVFVANDRIVAIVDNASTGTYASNWLKLDYTDAVLSVAGKTGAVTLDAADIAETAGLKIMTSAERTKLSGIETAADVTDADNVGSSIHGATAKTTPVDADTMPLIDSAASNVLKKVTWANIKATIKAYYDAVTSTFTNKTMIASTNVVEEITTTASSSTPTPTGGSLRNFFTVTALAAGATFAAPSGTPANGNRLVIRVKDNGTARTLAFNAIYRAIGVTLPTTTVISKTLYLGCIYNSADSKWDVIAYAVEA